MQDEVLQRLRFAVTGAGHNVHVLKPRGLRQADIDVVTWSLQQRRTSQICFANGSVSCWLGLFGLGLL